MNLSYISWVDILILIIYSLSTAQTVQGIQCTLWMFEFYNTWQKEVCFKIFGQVKIQKIQTHDLHISN